VEATAFHDRWRAAKGTAMPSREDIGAALSGHLCRCGAYDGIFHAVTEACEGRFDGDNIVSPRLEARDKVTGGAKYTVDIRHDGQLEGIILRSHEAHARIGELDLAPALALPGVSAAISLLGEDRIVRYVGAPIAAVAAKDRKTAQAAIAANACRPRSDWIKRANPTRLLSSTRPTARRPAMFRKVAARPRRGKPISAGRRRRSRKSRKKRGAGSIARGRRKTRYWSRAPSAPERNRMPAWSRTPPSPVSTATA
jgi:xanthine dehydrogenase YagR molybdenum-binding subunit